MCVNRLYEDLLPLASLAFKYDHFWLKLVVNIDLRTIWFW